MLDQIPIEVRDYLTANDGLAQAAVKEKYPNLRQTLDAPETRAAIIRYLASREPWADKSGFTRNVLGFLQNGASEEEAASIRPLLRHPDPWVRLRTYEYLMAIYYPPRDHQAMSNLFQEMLDDSDEIVRVQAARWIKGLNMSSEMHDFLQRWVKLAVERKWDTQESFSLIQALPK